MTKMVYIEFGPVKKKNLIYWEKGMSWVLTQLGRGLNRDDGKLSG